MSASNEPPIDPSPGELGATPKSRGNSRAGEVVEPLVIRVDDSETKAESENTPLIDKSAINSETDSETPKKPRSSFSFRAYIEGLNTRNRILWLLILSLLGGGIAAGVTYLIGNLALTSLSVVGVPSLLGLTGLAIPVLLAALVSAFATLMVLILLESVITKRKLSTGAFIALIALSGLAFAALGVFIVATTPAMFSTLSFGLGPVYGPLAALGITAVTLSIAAMLVMGITYTRVNSVKGQNRGNLLALAEGEMPEKEWRAFEATLDAKENLSEKINLIVAALAKYPIDEALLSNHVNLLLKRAEKGDAQTALEALSLLAKKHPGSDYEEVYSFQKDVVEVLLQHESPLAARHEALSEVKEGGQDAPGGLEQQPKIASTEDSVKIIALVLESLVKKPFSREAEDDVDVAAERKEALLSAVDLAMKIDPRSSITVGKKDTVGGEIRKPQSPADEPTVTYLAVRRHIIKGQPISPVSLAAIKQQLPELEHVQGGLRQYRLEQEQAKPRRLVDLSKGDKGQEEQKEQESKVVQPGERRTSFVKPLEGPRDVEKPTTLLAQQGNWQLRQGQRGAYWQELTKEAAVARIEYKKPNDWIDPEEGNAIETHGTWEKHHNHKANADYYFDRASGKYQGQQPEGFAPAKAM